MSSFCSSLHIELQQRGVEFTQLFGKYGHLRAPLLERMPPMEMVRQEGDAQTNGDLEQLETKSDDSPKHTNNESVRSCILLSLHFNILIYFF